MSDVETYRRSQVEWSLWQFFREGRGRKEAIPSAFHTRIKRLLDLDRGDNLEGKSETPHQRFAFSEEAPGGKGTDVAFRPFNAFCLALGLELLEIGFKQSEIVFLLRHIRDDLEDWFIDIQEEPTSGRQRQFATHRSNVPSFEESGTRYVDARVFMVLRRIELTEVHGSEPVKGVPVILRPVYCRGIDALRDELHKMGWSNRKAMVLEIAHAATEIPQTLSVAPLVKRGRG